MKERRVTGKRKKKERARLWKEETGVVVDEKTKERPEMRLSAGAGWDAI